MLWRAVAQAALLASEAAARRLDPPVDPATAVGRIADANGVMWDLQVMVRHARWHLEKGDLPDVDRILGKTDERIADEIAVLSVTEKSR